MEDKDKMPPNLDIADCCEYCEHYRGGVNDMAGYFCDKYKTYQIGPLNICDDYE